MKFNIELIKCNKCGKAYDKNQECCHHCQTKNPSRTDISLKTNDFWIGPGRQIALFLVGLIIFNLVAAVLASIIRAVGKANFPEKEDLIAFLNQPNLTMFINVMSYLIIFIAIIAIMYPFLNSLFSKFKNWKTWAWGIGGGVILIIESIVYGLIISLAIENDGNANQQAVVSMIELFPLTSLLTFGIVGPLVEEFTYRVGLFNFCSRFNRIVAYVVTMLIFGLIHFDYEALSIGGNALIIEFINLPNYIIAGCILCFVYEKSSWAGSSLAHMTNNIYATLISIIAYNLA